MLSEEEKKAIVKISEILKSNGLVNYWYGDEIKTILNLIENKQKEIEVLEKTLKCMQDSWYKDTQLIEELKKRKDLQKENEELKEWYDLFNKINPKKMKELADSFNEKVMKKVSQDYISKDKIREKIKEYDKMINATYKDMTVQGDIRRDNCLEIKKILNELLEE